MKAVKPMRKKAFIAKLLVLCMIVALLPTVSLVASADDSNSAYYTVKADATSNGTVSIYYKVDNDTYRYNTLDASATYSVKADTEVKITLTPDEGYYFDSDSYYTIGGDVKQYKFQDTDGSVGNAVEKVITLTGNLTIHAVFEKEQTPPSVPSAPSMTVKTETAANGSFTVSNRYAGVGQTVTVTTKPNAGYIVDKVAVTDNRGNEVSVTNHVDGTYSFVMPTNRSLLPVTVKVTFKKAPVFTDVPKDAYYADAVAWAVSMGITNGNTETTFNPEGTCERGEMVTFLWRAAGKPEPASGTKNPFVDVKESDYFYKAVLWAVEKGITNGTDETHFSPYDKVERDQVVTFLYRYEGEPNVGKDIKVPYTDVDTDAYYADAVVWANENKVTNGTSDTTFAPSENCTRGQVVTFLYRDHNLED